MGKGPDDITGEIEGLRQQSDIIVDELLRRATLPNVAHGVTAAVAERASLAVNEASAVVSEAASTVSRMADEMPEPVREHSFAATYAGVGVLAGIMGFAVSWIAATRRSSASQRAADRVRFSSARAGDIVRGWLRGGEEIRGNARLVTVRSEPSMVKRLLWVGLASVMATLGSMLFKRMTATAWRSTMHEEPPRG